MSVPILIISDNPTTSTGLGRITADVALQMNDMPEFRVGVLGGGGTTSRELPYQLYPTSFIARDYVIPDLPRIWKDFAGQEKGIVLTIWNHTWLDWLVRPQRLPDGEMKKFLMEKPFKVWGYIPIDGERADGTTSEGPTLAAFDRLLAYTQYGAAVISKTTGKEVEHLGHGTDTSVFYPRSRAEGRRRLAQIPKDSLMVGCVATNTHRKDWPLAFETCAELNRMGEKVTLWAHTDNFSPADSPHARWDLQELAKFYQVKTVLTNFHFALEDMAYALSACDVTLGVGSGEGWGMPMAESLACGVPVVTGDYAGATEFVPSSMRVKPTGYKIDTIHMIKRPVYDPRVWAARAKAVADTRDTRESLLDEQFQWANLWPKWQEWLKAGLR